VSEPTIDCDEASGTRGCTTRPVDPPPPSALHPRFPLHVHATLTGALWSDPRLLSASDEGVVGSAGLVAPLVKCSQVPLGQFPCQSEKCRTTTRLYVIAAVFPHDSQVAFLTWMDKHASSVRLLSSDFKQHHLCVDIAEFDPRQARRADRQSHAPVWPHLSSGFFAARAHRRAVRRRGWRLLCTAVLIFRMLRKFFPPYYCFRAASPIPAR